MTMNEREAVAKMTDELVSLFMRRIAGRLASAPYDLSADAATEALCDIENEARALFEANRDMIIDPPSEGHLRISALLLSTFRKLKEKQPDIEKVVYDIDQALVQPFRDRVDGWLETRFGLKEENADEAFDKVAQNFASRGAAQYGESFEYVQEKADSAENLVQIRKCFFNDFFRRNQALEVLPILCGMDMVWAAALNDGPYNVRFERPSRLAAGQDACRFYFYRK